MTDSRSQVPVPTALADGAPWLEIDRLACYRVGRQL
jgi:hypothetical protein